MLHKNANDSLEQSADSPGASTKHANHEESLIRLAKSCVDTSTVMVHHDAVIDDQPEYVLVEAWVKVPKNTAQIKAATEGRLVGARLQGSLKH